MTSFHHSLISQIISKYDFWWPKAALMLLGLVAAVVYLTWSAIHSTGYMWGPYISPVYAASWIPSWWKISPAFLLLWIPIGFRATCYYARKVYYRSVFLDPGNCAAPEPYRKNYKGETAFPFILNNFHRYFLYLAIALTVLHWFEFFRSLRFEGSWYVGLGTIIFLIDTVALTLYVFSCHSWRYIVGGGRRCISGGCCGSVRMHGWKRISFFNQFHGVWFWVSLYSIIAADLYIRLLAGEILPFDLHIIF